MFVMLLSNEGYNVVVNTDQVQTLEPSGLGNDTIVTLATRTIKVRGSVQDTAAKLNAAHWDLPEKLT
jgi:hypothetical protein